MIGFTLCQNDGCEYSLSIIYSIKMLIFSNSLLIVCHKDGRELFFTRGKGFDIMKGAKTKLLIKSFTKILSQFSVLI